MAAMEEFPSVKKKLRLKVRSNAGADDYSASEVPTEDLYEEADVGQDNMGNTTPQSDQGTPANAAALYSAAGGGGKNQVGNLATTYGLLSLGADGAAGAVAPYAIAGGLGLSVLAAKEERKQRQKELEYQAKQNQLERQQAAISRLIGISSSLRQL